NKTGRTTAKTESSARNPPAKTRTQWILAEVFIRDFPLEVPIQRNCSLKGQQKRPTPIESPNRRSASQYPFVRFSLPAQTVDATPSSALIQQCFPGRADLFGSTWSKPSQGSVPTYLTLASGISLCFHCKLGPCCVLCRPIATTALVGTYRTFAAVAVSPWSECLSGRVFRRPRDLTGAAVGQIGDVAGAGCGDSGFDGRVGLFAGPDAIEEILHVVDRAVAEALCLDHRIVFACHAFVKHAKAAPVEL